MSKYDNILTCFCSTEYIFVKTDTKLKVEKLDPISEVLVEESFDRSTKYLITNMQIPWREQTFVLIKNIR